MCLPLRALGAGRDPAAGRQVGAMWITGRGACLESSLPMPAAGSDPTRTDTLSQQPGMWRWPWARHPHTPFPVHAAGVAWVGSVPGSVLETGWEAECAAHVLGPSLRRQAPTGKVKSTG